MFRQYMENGITKFGADYSCCAFCNVLILSQDKVKLEKHIDSSDHKSHANSHAWDKIPDTDEFREVRGLPEESFSLLVKNNICFINNAYFCHFCCRTFYDFSKAKAHVTKKEHLSNLQINCFNLLSSGIYYKIPHYHCQPCNRNFDSINQVEQHVLDKKHIKSKSEFDKSQVANEKHKVSNALVNKKQTQNSDEKSAKEKFVKKQQIEVDLLENFALENNIDTIVLKENEIANHNGMLKCMACNSKVTKDNISKHLNLNCHLRNVHSKKELRAQDNNSTTSKQYLYCNSCKYYINVDLPHVQCHFMLHLLQEQSEVMFDILVYDQDKHVFKCVLCNVKFFSDQDVSHVSSLTHLKNLQDVLLNKTDYPRDLTIQVVDKRCLKFDLDPLKKFVLKSFCTTCYKPSVVDMYEHIRKFDRLTSSENHLHESNAQDLDMSHINFYKCHMCCRSFADMGSLIEHYNTDPAHIYRIKNLHVFLAKKEKKESIDKEACKQFDQIIITGNQLKPTTANDVECTVCYESVKTARKVLSHLRTDEHLRNLYPANSQMFVGSTLNDKFIDISKNNFKDKYFFCKKCNVYLKLSDHTLIQCHCMFHLNETRRDLDFDIIRYFQDVSECVCNLCDERMPENQLSEHIYSLPHLEKLQNNLLGKIIGHCNFRLHFVPFDSLRFPFSPSEDFSLRNVCSACFIPKAREDKNEDESGHIRDFERISTCGSKANHKHDDASNIKIERFYYFRCFICNRSFTDAKHLFKHYFFDPMHKYRLKNFHAAKERQEHLINANDLAGLLRKYVSDASDPTEVKDDGKSESQSESASKDSNGKAPKTRTRGSKNKKSESSARTEHEKSSPSGEKLELAQTTNHAPDALASAEAETEADEDEKLKMKIQELFDEELDGESESPSESRNESQGRGENLNSTVEPAKDPEAAPCREVTGVSNELSFVATSQTEGENRRYSLLEQVYGEKQNDNLVTAEETSNASASAVPNEHEPKRYLYCDSCELYIPEDQTSHVQSHCIYHLQDDRRNKHLDDVVKFSLSEDKSSVTMSCLACKCSMLHNQSLDKHLATKGHADKMNLLLQSGAGTRRCEERKITPEIKINTTSTSQGFDPKTDLSLAKLCLPCNSSRADPDGCLRKIDLELDCERAKAVDEPEPIPKLSYYRCYACNAHCENKATLLQHYLTDPSHKRKIAALHSIAKLPKNPNVGGEQHAGSAIPPSKDVADYGETYLAMCIEPASPRNFYNFDPDVTELTRLGVSLLVPLDERGVCIPCNAVVDVTDLQKLYEHLMSKAHLRCVQNCKENVDRLERAKSCLIEEDKRKKTLRCLECNVTIDEEDMESHRSSPFHANEIAKWNRKTDSLFNELLGMLKEFWYYANRFCCQLCQFETSREYAFVVHLMQPEHRDKVKLTGKSHKMIKCLKCLSCCCGVADYSDHCKESFHRDYKKKNKIEIVPKLNRAARKLLMFPNPIAIDALDESDRVLQAELNEEMDLLRDVEDTVKSIYPNAKAYAFGSRRSCLGFITSDLDVYLDCEDKYGEVGSKDDSQAYIKRVQTLFLGQHKKIWGCENVLLHTRVPIMKLEHRPSCLKCDVSFMNGLGVEKSLLIRKFVLAHRGCRELILYLKKWFDAAELYGTDAVNSYAISWLAIFYLQSANGFPSVRDLIVEKNESKIVAGWECGFPKEIRISCTRSFDDFLKGFFCIYANFDYQTCVICPFLGRAIKKSDFAKVDNLPEDMSGVYKKRWQECEPFRFDSPLCIQDPVDLSQNLTKAVSKIQMNNLRQFAKQSYEKICSGKK